ncbi:AraC family transcriptional regulator [Ktedonosporobacter rubrisoli]|uniref:AraC family transcriptional regulator n=1 Tax=Ktedonosporobacter rubrisoli TaxID=2509675 RepID=A0A4P6JLZ8_KTERU|nr:AraC family transcriptional regulator [Ktedonosporobacter rubrisoli]QBD76258.1 AraC family transcriptional regulator [Ktedonosporobacter rubrisoli]
MIQHTNEIPVVPLNTCSYILWRDAHSLIGYEPLRVKDSRTGPHFDDMYTLELVCQGMQEIHLDGNWHPVPPLHVIWTSPYIQHAHHIASELETIFVIFRKEMVERVWQELYKNCAFKAPHASILPCPPQLQNALYQLLQEVRRCGQTSNYIISLHLQLVLATFLRSTARPGFPAPTVPMQPSALRHASDGILQAMRLLEKHHACSSLALENIASTIGLSSFYFSRRFKQEVGTTPGHYLRQQRLNHALQLLFTTSLSIEEISYRSGFSSSRQFTEACKVVLGQAPSTLRKARGLFFLSPAPAAAGMPPVLDAPPQSLSI